jgi:DNA-binding NarL/FixJ family response regulator
MNGFELTKELLANEPALRVLAVSGLSHEGDVTHALEAGATAFLLKGGLYDEVGDAIVAAAGPHHH